MVCARLVMDYFEMPLQLEKCVWEHDGRKPAVSYAAKYSCHEKNNTESKVGTSASHDPGLKNNIDIVLFS